MSGWTERDLLDRAQRLPDDQSLMQAAQRHTAGIAQKPHGRIRPPKSMNKGETAYYAHLAMEQRLGAVAFFEYEGITLKLGEDLRYTPDFLVMLADGSIQFHEIKGRKKFKRPDGSVIREGPFVEEDARAKIVMAAAKFPFPFRMVWPAANGEWEAKEY